MNKQALVIHSGGMDSSICLALAVKEYGKENVLSLSFQYDQRHRTELDAACTICREWNVDHTILPINCLSEITSNSLTSAELPIRCGNTLVVGRNGLMARIGAIHADQLGADCIYMGVIEVEAWNSGYRDCTRAYMDRMEEILRIDLANPSFTICTPLVKMSKPETLALADELRCLEFLLEHTVTCYEGIKGVGCKRCPACLLRNAGLEQFLS